MMRRDTLIKRSIKGALVIGGLCALVPSVYGQGIGLKKLDEMLTPSASMVARGKVVYERQCVTCHGATGANDSDWAKENNLPAGGFTTGEIKRGGVIQIYDLISTKTPGVEHPVYDGYVPYQDRWAVSHYVRSLSPVKPSDPPESVERAQFEAINGVCREAIKGSISDRVKPRGEEQLASGKEIYAAQCASCHGEEGKGNGAAAAALQPAPRNFVDANVKWTNGTSPLAIFGTLTVGIEGTSMAAYDSLTEDERWALTHYVREWIPDQQLKESTEEQIMEVCRSLSAPAKPDAISVELAMKFLAEDAPNKRAMARSKLGPVYKYGDSDATRGGELYAQSCASCHGAQGEGTRPVGPYGAYPPFLYLSVAPLQNVDAAGSYDTFAQRSTQGVHATLPDMSGEAMLSEKDWKDLQAFVSIFQGDAQFIEASQAARLTAPLKLIVLDLSATGELTAEGSAEAPITDVAAYFQALEAQGPLRFQVTVRAAKDATQERATEVLSALKSAGVEEMRMTALEPAPSEAPAQPAAQESNP